MEYIKKLFAFVALIVFVLGIGCVGYLFYYGEPFFAVINIMLLAEAFPYADQQMGYLRGKEE